MLLQTRKSPWFQHSATHSFERRDAKTRRSTRQLISSAELYSCQPCGNRSVREKGQGKKTQLKSGFFLSVQQCSSIITSALCVQNNKPPNRRIIKEHWKDKHALSYVASNKNSLVYVIKIRDGS